MAQEHISDLGIIAMHYGEWISVDDICTSFFQTYPQKLFQASVFYGLITLALT